MIAPTLGLAIALLAAAPPPAEGGGEALAPGAWTEPLEITGTVDGATATARVHVYLPAGYAERAPGRRFPLVIALPGWNHAPERFRRDGPGLGALADRHGVVLAIPAMGKAIYATRFTRDSRRTWAPVPAARWVGEVALPRLRAALAVRQDRGGTAIIGYSTGGRGAALVASLYPEFAFAGSASGTFDLTRLAPDTGEYRIHAVVLGARARHADAWRRDNGVAPDRIVGLAGVALYVAHGEADAVVPPDQLEALRDALRDPVTRADRPGDTWVLVPGAGHDAAFWSSQWGPMFDAMARALSPAPREATPDAH